MTAAAGMTLAGAPREELRQGLRSLGFDEVRFATARPPETGLRDWLAAGYHAEMAWMERTADKRMDPGLVLPGAKSVIMLGVNYWPGFALKNQHSGVESSSLKIENPLWARYALHEDYHETMKLGLVAAGRLLQQLGGLTSSDYRCYVDTGPVMERGWAARSGLGFRGKNGMLISRHHGNWLFLSSILVRWEIEADAPLRKKPLPPSGTEPVGLLCGKCTRCLDACPTQAFPRPGVVDARRCVSYQTIENKGIIPRALRAGIGTRIYGCDVCLEVCPWNRFAREGRRVLLASRHDLAELGLAEILAMTPVRFAAVFRRTAVKRLKLTGLLRNACVVAGNTGDRALLPALVALAAHESAVVRAHAVWAVRRIAGDRAGELLAARRVAESDAGVLAEFEGEL